MKLSKDDWEKALANLRECQKAAKELLNVPGVNMAYYLMGTRELEQRYVNGERTRKLYVEMINVH